MFNLSTNFQHGHCHPVFSITIHLTGVFHTSRAFPQVTCSCILIQKFMDLLWVSTVCSSNFFTSHGYPFSFRACLKTTNVLSFWAYNRFSNRARHFFCWVFELFSSRRDVLSSKVMIPSWKSRSSTSSGFMLLTRSR